MDYNYTLLIYLSILLHYCTSKFNCDSDNMTFPSSFQFGVATASYQIEGGWNADGKGENIWDRLTHEHPDWVKDKSNGDIACDSYHNYETDVKALKYIGVQFYRFSLSWSRILPTGLTNEINQAGIQYYNSLINHLISNNIEPMVTLYHWDLPQPLQELGGWPNEWLATCFRNYANVAFKMFGDRVKKWITFNEPNDICESAYSDGDDAPAINKSGIGGYLCGRTLLLAHALTYRLYDSTYRATQNGQVGITINSIWAEPKTNSPDDVAAAERAMQMNYGWWAHPIYSKQGDYPEIMKNRIANRSKLENFIESRLPPFSKKEIRLIRGTYDFLGLNHYSTWLVSNHEYPIGEPSHSTDMGVIMEQNPKWKSSALSWLKVVPWGFKKLLNWIKNEFQNPLVYVTENGFADLEGLKDDDRIDYHTKYLQALLEAIIKDDCNVQAYTIWSLLDNMEWREGYKPKFGLFHVDFSREDRHRCPKESANFYKNIINTRSIPVN